MDLGWTKSWRKRWESDLATYPYANHLFQYLIDMASYRERDASFRYQCVPLKAGDVLVGRDSLSTRTGLSARTLRTCLEYLKSTNRITIKSTNRFSIVSIIKWDTYQGDNTETDQQSGQQIDQQPTSNRPATDHIQEVKNLRTDQKQPTAPAGARKVISPHKETAEKIVEYYEKEVRNERDSRYRARLNVQSLLTKGNKKEVLWECVNLYANDKEGKDPQFRKVAGNFFGRDAVYRNYIDEAMRIVEVEYAEKR